MVSAKVVRNHMVPSRAEWRGETDNQATTPVGYSFIHSFIYLLRTIDKHDIKQITSRTARLTAALTTALNVT